MLIAILAGPHRFTRIYRLLRETCLRLFVPTTRPEPLLTVRRRPKDRKAQIARASAEAFSASGYHAVSMEAIAGKVGISAAALYRHYPGKYELFRDAVLSLGQQMVDATECVETADGGDPRELLDRAVHGLVDAAMANRRSGGLYRWEARYLRASDQAALIERFRLANRRIHRQLTAIHPTLSSTHRWMLTSAMLSVIGSIMDHRVKLPAAEIHSLLVELAGRMLSAELPSPEQIEPRPARPRIFVKSGAGNYEALLNASMMLFARYGYRETSMEQIASAVEMPTSGIYRYFTGKSDILATALRRASDRVSAELSPVMAAEAEPEQVLTQLIEAYVGVSFANPELACVYYAEHVNLAPGDQAMLRNVQRSTIDSWTQLLVAARPQRSPAHARFMVHAAMALVVDLGRLVNYDNSVYSQACVRRLMELVLLG
jgi:AcrR family transcriptional regulator